MNLQDIFFKQVDRTIEGVIKADDVENLKLEIEEYVLTNEITKRLGAFLDAYNDYRGANGVWISGFFGSGKSHLLKILAYLLENYRFDDASMLDLFLPKCEENPMLKAEIKKAVATPSESILFNIDQKATTISKSEFDAVLSVFVKVFNDHCGYYGHQPYVAQFERDLDKRDSYTDFKKVYQEIAGYPWSFGREQVILEEDNVARAYAQVSDSSFESAKGIVDRYRQDHHLSIEDFAEMVNEYIEKQAPDFRLNFFVDEVGQYVANNVKLMTNLQTIAESLATKCRGQTWILVTAQDDMSDISGLDDKSQGQDFSKIQDRFKTRMKLTSANVDEVIQKRLLEKNKTGKRYLRQLYQKEKNNLGTLFKFSGDSIKYRTFQGEKEFIESYPFIPYQFSLFQSAIESLSEYHAFEGQHSSVGERSILEVFQKVVVEIKEEDIGRLATFDRMYEGIRTVLKSQIQTSIRKAENNLSDPFTVQVLKTLFLIKYVKEFKATLRNIRVLMYGKFGLDLPTLEEKIESALLILERQTYIQRHGKEYEFLTNEEQDVEKEIKNTPIDLSEVVEEIGKIVFSDIIKEYKIRDTETKQDFPFTRKIDDRINSRTKELAIHIITPFYSNADNFSILQGNTMGKPELMVVLPDDKRLRTDLKIYKQTEKYIRQNGKASQRKSIGRILAEKGQQNTTRYEDIRNKIKELAGKARFIVSGNEIEIAGSDPKNRIHKGFESLVKTIYPNLKMLKGIQYSKKEISNYLNITKEGLFGADGLEFNEGEDEVISFIKRMDKSAGRVSLKKLEKQFTQAPYGWPLSALQCILARACGRDKVMVLEDSNILNDSVLENALTNTYNFSNVILRPQVAFTAHQKRELKDFNNTFFDQPIEGATAKDLGQATKQAFAHLADEVETLMYQAERYSFAADLKSPLKKLQELKKKPYTFFLTDLYDQQDSLFDAKENVIDPIKQFMHGANKEIHQNATTLLAKQEPNFIYLDSDLPERLRSIVDDSACYRGNKMRNAKRLFSELHERIDELLMKERQKAIEKVSEKQESFHQKEKYHELDAEQQRTLNSHFEDFLDRVENQTLVATIRDRLSNFLSHDYNQVLTLMAQWTEPDQGETSSTQVSEPEIQFITREELEIEFVKEHLENESDVEMYVEHIRKVMLKAVQDGKRIQV